ncbi:helix-turn-helix domain-containing protein [Endozoicomonas sp. 4G]|uniref:helix-turn-helix domain-containing protein n=1 Tax=Endozoicomonas sp. 4G TaxID=2872754 RepID=UPI0020789DD8|nr:helix-turn-helix domain-containing protein [Endozoicomonas sp. 4G]
MNNPHIGSSFDDFLAEDGLLPESQAEAMKRVIAWQISEYLKSEGVNKSAFARLLGTSRSQLDRLLDPANTSLNLKTLSNAAEAMGKKLELKLV